MPRHTLCQRQSQLGFYTIKMTVNPTLHVKTSETGVTFSSTTVWVQIVLQIFQSLDSKKEIFKCRVTSIFNFEKKNFFSFQFSLRYFLFALYFFCSFCFNFFPRFFILQTLKSSLLSALLVMFSCYSLTLDIIPIPSAMSTIIFPVVST
jgi:hypothetical protein